MYSKTLDHRRGFCIEVNCEDDPLVIRNSLLVELIVTLPVRFSKQNYETTSSRLGINQAVSNDLLEFLLSNNLVVSADDIISRYPNLNTWTEYSWIEAFKYHEATRDYPFIKMDEPDSFKKDRLRMEDYKKEEEVPSIYQEIPSIKKVELDKFDFNDSLEKKVDNLVKEKDEFGLLSLFFNFCFGERSKQQFNVQGEFLRKIIPSGGSRHPTEVFYVAFNHESLANGVYHYNVKMNRLDLITKGQYYDTCKKGTFDLFDKYKSKPKGLLIFTALHERAMWRYRDARSWRAVLIDLGHALMIYRQLASRMGWNYYTYQKFDDHSISQLIGVDKLRQTPLYVGTIV